MGEHSPRNIYQCVRDRDSFSDPPLRAVLVDDAHAFRDAIACLLCRCGRFDVVATADDGVEALEAVRLHRPDLVMMDVQMPQMNGLEAASRIRDEFPATRILLFSSDDHPEYQTRAKALGATFVSKPQFAYRLCDLFADLFGACQWPEEDTA